MSDEEDQFWYARLEVNGVWCSSAPFETEDDAERWLDDSDLSGDIQGPFDEGTCVLHGKKMYHETGDGERYGFETFGRGDN